MTKKILTLFLLVSGIITAVLFRGGTILGGGESGVPFYNLNKMLAISHSPWLDGLLGAYIPQAVANIPLLAILSFVQGLNVPTYLIQALFTFFLILICLFSTYLLIRELFPRYSERLYVLSAFFYLFNFYSVMNIWTRFLLNFQVFYSTIPLFLFLYIRGLKTGDYKFFSFLLILSAILSYGFSSPAHIVIFWLLIFLVTVYYLLYIEWKRKIFFFSILVFVCWLLLNTWWIVPQISYSLSQSFRSISSSFFTTTGNFQGFNFLSQTLGRMSNLFLLKHGLYYVQDYDFAYKWPLIYKNSLGIILEWGFTLLALFVAIKERINVWVRFFLGIFLMGIFLAKGNSLPFGEIFDYGIRHIPFVQFFRNPFEKLGVFMSLGLSPLMGLGVEEGIKLLTSKRRLLGKLFLTFSVLYIILFLGLPFWTGLVYTGNKEPTNDPRVGIQVEVPDYYRKANEWISAQAGLFRFITLPIGGEGIFYKWPRGYIGVELSSFLFRVPNISSELSFPFYYSISSSLQKLFLKYPDFHKIAGLLNARYLIYRPDYDFVSSGMKDPEVIGGILDERSSTQSGLKEVAKFGQLRVYEFPAESFLPRFYIPNRLIKSDSETILLEEFFVADGNTTDVIFSGNNLPISEKDISTTIIRNNAVFRVQGYQFPSFTDAPYIFPYVSRLPSWKFYPLVLIKEKLGGLTHLTLADKTRWNLLLLGKRLIEAKRSIEIGDINGAKKALKRYKEELPKVVSDINVLNVTIKQPGEQIWEESRLFETFSSHKFLLNEFDTSELNQDGYISDIKELFIETISKSKIIPTQVVLSNEDFPVKNRVIYQFEVATPGEYEIVIPKTPLFPSAFEIGEEPTVQVDDKIYTPQKILRGQNIYIGRFFWEKGIHDIGVNQVPTVNLINNSSDFVLDTKQESQKEFELTGFDPYTQYDLSFSYDIEYGEGPLLRIGLDTDSYSKKSGERVRNYFFDKHLPPDDYYFSQKEYHMVFAPDPSASSARLILGVKPWNNCERIFYRKPSKCQNANFYEQYNKSTKVSIKNFEVTPRLPSEIYLLKLGNTKVFTPPTVTLDRLSQTKYTLDVKGASGPHLIVFSELFDAGWKLSLVNSASPLREERHILANGYANSWWIEKGGDYTATIEFIPQKHFILGSKISTASFVLISLSSLPLFLSKIFLRR